jgi:hypothetical protein
MYKLNEIKLIFQAIRTWEDLGKLCLVLENLLTLGFMRKDTHEYRTFYFLIMQTASKL